MYKRHSQAHKTKTDTLGYLIHTITQTFTFNYQTMLYNGGVEVEGTWPKITVDRESINTSNE